LPVDQIESEKNNDGGQDRAKEKHQGQEFGHNADAKAQQVVENAKSVPEMKAGNDQKEKQS
jgi:hypothetical protein